MQPKTINIETAKGINYIFVRDDLGRIQYFRAFSVPVKKWRFNLPFIYGCNSLNICTKLNGHFVPVKITKSRLKKHSSLFIKLPSPNWIKKNLTVNFDPNTQQLAYNEVGKSITLGPQFFKLPYFLQFFVYYHELGHNYYHSEENADLYAIKRYLEAGGSPSSILYALDEGLANSGLKTKRLEEAKNYLIKIQ